MKNITIRVDDRIQAVLNEISEKPVTATQEALEIFMILRRTTINELKYVFTKEEIIALLDSFNGLIPTWDYVASADTLAWHMSEAEKYAGAATRQGANPDKLIEKLKGLTSAQSTILQLELWAFWNRSDEPANLDDFVARFVTKRRTYDIQFDDDNNSNNKGFGMTLEEAKEYVQRYNGTTESYFEDYKGGTVSVICNETGETVHQETVK